MDEAATQAPSNVSPECALLALFFSLDSRADLLDVTWDYLLDIPLLIPHGEVSLKGWEELEPFLLEEVAAQRRERLKQRLRAAVREKVIGDWIARYVKGLSQDEEKTLKSRIETDLEQDSKKELGEYLELVLTDGIAKAEQKKKKEQRAGYPGHLWVAILGIAKLVVAFCWIRHRTIDPVCLGNPRPGVIYTSGASHLIPPFNQWFSSFGCGRLYQRTSA